MEEEASPGKNLHKILFHSQRHHPNADDGDDGGDDDDDDNDYDDNDDGDDDDNGLVWSGLVWAAEGF